MNYRIWYFSQFISCCCRLYVNARHTQWNETIYCLLRMKSKKIVKNSHLFGLLSRPNNKTMIKYGAIKKSRVQCVKCVWVIGILFTISLSEMAINDRRNAQTKSNTKNKILINRCSLMKKNFFSFELNYLCDVFLGARCPNLEFCVSILDLYNKRE